MKPLDRPICSIDVESTGVDPAKDRIIQLGVVKISGHYFWDHQLLFNPGIPIPPSSTTIHGITDEMVKDSPKFRECAKEILGLIGGCDLLGFNIHNFDLPILWEEFHRAGITWVIDFNVIDAGTIFKKMQPRTLEVAVRTYCGREITGAHDALADAISTWQVFQGQRHQHADLAAMDAAQIAKFSQFDERIDLAGKLVMIDGKPCYGFGKNKGTPICEDMGYANWMLQKDFSANTKMHLRAICEGILAEERSLYRQDEQNETSPF